jgi:predicted molibdopterin-dependent oxidoreductase YjgC
MSTREPERRTVSQFSRMSAGIDRGAPINIAVDGVSMQAFRGERVATVLLVNGCSALRVTPKGGERRSVFCAMGVCFECVVTVNGRPNIRSCMVPVEDEMVIETGVPSDR